MPKCETSSPLNLASLDDLADVPTIGAGIAAMCDGPDIDQVEAEMDEGVHLTSSLLFVEGAGDGVSHEGRDVRQVADAIAAVQRVPDAFEAFHLIADGQFALWDMVEALIELAEPVKVETLHVATLGFSKKNIAAMMAMLDADRVGRLWLLCSHYFANTSTDIWGFARAEIDKRAARAKFLSIRTHAKVVAIRLADGRTLSIEASANLRSCKNIEQITIFGQPSLYDFHRGWMADLFGRAEQ